MRDELQLMELVDRYLDGAMSQEELRAFEARLELNAELRQAMDDQRSLREGLHRVRLRPAVAAAHRSWWWKRNASWMVAGVLVIGLAVFIGFGGYGGADEQPVSDRDAPAMEVPSQGMVLVVAEKAPSFPSVLDSATASETLVAHVETLPNWTAIGPASLKQAERSVVEPVEERSPVNVLGSIADTVSGELSLSTGPGHELGLNYRAVIGTIPHERQDSADVKPLLATVEQPSGAEHQPSFPGGWQAMHDFLKKRLRVPEDLKGTCTVLVGFTVGKKGELSNIEVVEGSTSELNKEALRVIRMMPRWYPCRVGDKPVKSRIEVPIRFGDGDAPMDVR